MNTAILSLGTNLGNKLDNLNNAITKLLEIGKIVTCSTVYQTPPWGFESDDFYNISLCLKTDLDAESLLHQLLSIEKELGRKRNEHLKGYQARPLDIDILFFNNDIFNTSNLIIPHPRIQDRKFVLIPTIEIIQNFNHPIFQEKLETLLDNCSDTGKIIKTEFRLQY